MCVRAVTVMVVTMMMAVMVLRRGGRCEQVDVLVDRHEPDGFVHVEELD